MKKYLRNLLKIYKLDWYKFMILQPQSRTRIKHLKGVIYNWFYTK